MLVSLEISELQIREKDLRPRSAFEQSSVSWRELWEPRRSWDRFKKKKRAPTPPKKKKSTRVFIAPRKRL